MQLSMHVWKTSSKANESHLAPYYLHVVAATSTTRKAESLRLKFSPKPLFFLCFTALSTPSLTKELKTTEVRRFYISQILIYKLFSLINRKDICQRNLLIHHNNKFHIYYFPTNTYQPRLSLRNTKPCPFNTYPKRKHQDRNFYFCSKICQQKYKRETRIHLSSQLKASKHQALYIYI